MSELSKNAEALFTIAPSTGSEVIGAIRRNRAAVTSPRSIGHCALSRRRGLRQVNMTRRYASFVLNTPGQHHEFLVWNDCGQVNDLPDAQPILELQQHLADRFAGRDFIAPA